MARPLPLGRAVFFAPFPLLFTWLVGLLSLALLGGGVYLLWAWYVGALVGTGYLVGGVVMTLWSLVGRWVVLAFHPRGPDEPHTLRPESEVRLPRPDGTSLYVERYGPADAPAVVLTHGAGANRTSWYYAIRALSQRFQVLVWDMPGLGHSDKPRRGDYSLERHAHDLEAVLNVAAGGGGGPPAAPGTTTRGGPAPASGFVRAVQKPLLEPLLHLTVWVAPL